MSRRSRAPGRRGGEPLGHLARRLVGEGDRQDLAGGAIPSSIRCAVRSVITRVLPEPAPAITSSGPSVSSTASRCSGSSASRLGAAGRRVGQRVSGGRAGRRAPVGAGRSRRAPSRRVGVGHAGPFGGRPAPGGGPARVCGARVGLGPGHDWSVARRRGRAWFSYERPGIGTPRRRSSSARAARKASPRRSTPQGPPISSEARSKMRPPRPHPKQNQPARAFRRSRGWLSDRRGQVAGIAPWSPGRTR